MNRHYFICFLICLKTYKTEAFVTRTGPIHTSLFLACTNSPPRERDYALDKANLLRKKLAEEHVRLNQTTYHAMLQAFGRLGDLETAYSIVDEMKTQGLKV